MREPKTTLWESFLKPIVSLLIDEDELRQLYQNIEWEQESACLSDPSLVYPLYYSRQDFHGIDGGYLNPEAAVTYDPVTQYVLPPHELWVRQDAIKTVGGEPRQIIDLGCGTGSSTLMLKQTFPQAKVTGLDLSPYMLVMAEHKARQARLNIHWRHGKAEATGLEAEAFDTVFVSLLFHETPPHISEAIVRESWRLLVPGGQMIILDGNQKTLRESDWLTTIFEEPYIKAYAAGSVDDWMREAGFEAVQTREIWWVHQITQGMKPTGANPQVQQEYRVASDMLPVPL
ncbi:MAG: class I SAM-dependent methyltransferase [Cyanophyceae cyanobacterium]